MASFKAKFPVLQELFAKNHRRGPFGPPPPSGARVKLRDIRLCITYSKAFCYLEGLRKPVAWEKAYEIFIFRTLLATIYENFCSGPPLEKILGAPLSLTHGKTANSTLPQLKVMTNTFSTP